MEKNPESNQMSVILILACWLIRATVLNYLIVKRKSLNPPFITFQKLQKDILSWLLASTCKTHVHVYDVFA